MVYVPVQYPKWLYHATLPACIVATHEEREALGDEWAEHPDLVTAPAAAEDAGAEEWLNAPMGKPKPATKKRATNGR